MTNRLATYEDLLQENRELKELLEGRIQVLEFKPGDILAITYKGCVRPDEIHRLTALIESRFPGLKAMIFDEDPKLSVLRLSVTGKSE